MRRVLHVLFIGVGAIAFAGGLLAGGFVLPNEYLGPFFQIAASAFALAIVTAPRIRAVA